MTSHQEKETLEESFIRILEMPRYERREIIRAAKKSGKEGAAFIFELNKFKEEYKELLST